MAEQVIDVPHIGNVIFRRRRGTHSIRLKIQANGQAVVTLPYLVPYTTAVSFVKQHGSWVTEERAKRTVPLEDGMPIGRAHILDYRYEPGITQVKTRVTASEVIIRYDGSVLDAPVQQATQRGAIRALKQEAVQFLPKRLQDIAFAEEYSYNGVSIKRMRGRWGSCNQNKHITLNIFLMELPIELIDYVILHELAHTRALNHGKEFWEEFESHLPHAKILRRKIREYQPTVPAIRVS